MRLISRFRTLAALLLSALSVVGPVAATEWYVAPRSGFGATANDTPRSSDDNLGTRAAPFATLQKAAAMARPGDTVFVRGGSYQETVFPGRSGSPGKPITFQPYPNERVTLRGTRFIAPNLWKKDSDGRWYAPWPGEYKSANNQSDQIFLNDRMAQLARWPREKNNNVSRPYQAKIAAIVKTEKTEKKAPGPEYDIWRTTFVCPDFDEPDGRWTNAKIWLNTGNATDEQDGNGQTGIVLATNRARHEITIELDSGGATGAERPHNFQFGNGSKFYLFDPSTVDGLQNNEEWWRDRANNRLYVKVADGDAPSRRFVSVKQRDWAFDLSERSYITVRGFDLFACSITTDNQAGNGVGNGGNRKNSVALAHHIVLDGLHCRYVSHFTDQSGNFQTQWNLSSGLVVSGSDCIIQNCEIIYSAGCGIVCIGERNKVVNNIVQDVGYNATDGGGIGLGTYADTRSVDAEIAYNTVYNVGIDGIEFGSLKNSDLKKPGIARIHHNIVHDCVLQSADSGGLHAFSSDGQWTRVDHNVVYSIGGPENTGYQYFGIYLDYAPDEGRSPGRYIVDHNVVYNTPSPLNLNHANTVLIANNTLISATLVARSSISSNGGTYEGVILKNNLGNTVYRGDLDEASVKAGKNKAIYQNNLIVPTNAVFVDAANPDFAKRDYRLKPSATALIDKGVSVAPWNDATPPDIGAYEFNQPRWQAGFRE